MILRRADAQQDSFRAPSASAAIFPPQLWMSAVRRGEDPHIPLRSAQGPSGVLYLVMSAPSNPRPLCQGTRWREVGIRLTVRCVTRSCVNEKQVEDPAFLPQPPPHPPKPPTPRQGGTYSSVGESGSREGV